MTSQHMNKNKKVSFLKNQHNNEQQIYYVNDSSVESQSTNQQRNKKSSSFALMSPSLKTHTKSVYYFRDRELDRLNQTENKTINQSTAQSSSYVHSHHDSQSQSLEKFKKINKLLFFKSRDKKSNENIPDEIDTSPSIQKTQKKKVSKNDKKSQFDKKEDLDSKNINKNIRNSYFNTLKKWPIIIDKNDFQYKQDYQQQNKSHQNSLQIQQQERSKYYYNDSFSSKNKQSRDAQQTNSTEGMSYEQWISNYNANEERKRQENSLMSKKDQFSEEYNQLVRSTSLQKMINKIHSQKSELNLKQNISQNNSLQQDRVDSTTVNSIESPFKKMNDQQYFFNRHHTLSNQNQINISLKQDKQNSVIEEQSPRNKRFNSISTPTKKNDEILIKDIQIKDTATPYFVESPVYYKKTKQTLTRSNKRYQSTKPSLSFHRLKSEENQKVQFTARDQNNSPKRLLQINNLQQYSKKLKSDGQTPSAQIHHFNKNIKRQIRQSRNQQDLCIYRNGAMTSSHVLIKAGDSSSSDKRSQFKEGLQQLSKTPLERQRIISQQTSIQLIQPSPEKNSSPTKSSNFFSNYVALTFKNSLMELRRRQQYQIIQKLSLNSKQALARLVIYINDMISEYQNIKKVSQIIYQLIYHIPYLVNMLFQNEKILLRERIDINYINNFLTNKSNMENCYDNRNETYEQMLENKISSDIVFLNEKLTEFIKRRFQDRFELISQNIIDEHSNVKNLEKQIEEKIAKMYRIEVNPNNNLLLSKHNYAGVDNYMFLAKSNNGITFASTHYDEIKRLGEFNCIDQQNVAISYELDNLYTKVQNETSSGANEFEFPIEKYSFDDDDDY